MEKKGDNWSGTLEASCIKEKYPNRIPVNVEKVVFERSWLRRTLGVERQLKRPRGDAKQQLAEEVKRRSRLESRSSYSREAERRRRRRCIIIS